jgi:hypothetical protein
MKVWRAFKGTIFADGSPAYLDCTIDGLFWPTDKRKRQRMVVVIEEDISSDYDGNDFFLTEEALLKYLDCEAKK